MLEMLAVKYLLTLTIHYDRLLRQREMYGIEY